MLRFLRTLLSTWKEGHYKSTQIDLVNYLFHVLGRIMVHCSVPLEGGYCMSIKKRLKFYTAESASITSTVCEELILLLRKLHSIQSWNNLINDYIDSALQLIPQLVTQSQFATQLKPESKVSHEQQVFYFHFEYYLYANL